MFDRLKNLHRGICRVCGKKRIVNRKNDCFWCFDGKPYNPKNGE